MSATEQHAAVLADLDALVELERAATGGTWFAAVGRGKIPVVAVARQALAVFGSAGRAQAGRNATLVVALRNDAARALAGRRRTVERHAPRLCRRCPPERAHYVCAAYAGHTWPCYDYRDAAAGLGGC